MRDPKNAFAAASTSSGDSVARWKYFTARLHVNLCFVPRLRNAERGSGGEAPQGPKAPQGEAVQHYATGRPRLCSFLTSSAFWDGSTSGRTSSIPTSFATASAPFFESPETMMTVRPIFLRWATASALVGLIGSAMAITAYTVLFTTTI